jgi:hypothetical protein
MVGEKMKLLPGLGFERERSFSEWGGRESRRCSGGDGARADVWGPWGYVASKFYTLDTHQDGTSGPSACGARTVRGVDVVKKLTRSR